MLRLLLTIILLVAPRLAAPESRVTSCARFLAVATGQYIADVYKSGGLRILLKPERQNSKAGIYDRVIRAPTARLSEVLGLGRLEPTMVSLVLLSVVAMQGVDAASDEALNYKIEREIRRDAELYDDLLKFDYRFRGKEDRLEAYWLKMAYDRYYESRASHPVDTQSLSENLKYLQMFPHLQMVIVEGVKDAPGFRVPPESRGPLSEDKVLKLFLLNHELLLNFQNVVESLRKNAPPDDQQFTLAIFNLWQDGKLKRGDAQRILQEDLYWRTRFREWEVIGVTRLNVVNGLDLTLDDIRQEVLRDIKQEF